MKLASLNDGTKDGKLIIVSKDLKYYTDASNISPTMQSAIDNWSNIKAKLTKLYEDLNYKMINKNIFDQNKVYSPLPRSYQWADCSAFTNHLKLARKARGVDLPKSYLKNPLIYQGGSDDFLSPRSPIPILDENWGVDLEAEIAVITDYIPMGSNIEEIKDKILLVMIANDISLRILVPEEIDKGFGFLFGFFKGYIVSVCLYSILNWFYPYQNWGISAEDAFSFNLINKGSEVLIEEFPSSEDFIDTKEKIEKI